MMKFDLTCEVRQWKPGMTVRGALRLEKGVSTRLMRKMIHHDGGVWLNGRPARFGSPVKAGDVIGLIYPEESSDFPPQDIPIAPLYEDGDLLVIDKQPGVVVHPTKGHVDGTIANGIMKYMTERGESWRIRFVNRLDMNTSGVLLVGKNARAQSDFTKQAGRGEIEKRYIAIVMGIVTEQDGCIDLPIGLEQEGAVRRTVRQDGYPSVTRYRTLRRFDSGYSLLEVFLETGRTHQIRVHLAHIGHPVLGDHLYGGQCPAHMGRQALHAVSLKFRHPVRETALEVVAPLPADMEACVRRLEEREEMDGTDEIIIGGQTGG